MSVTAKVTDASFEADVIKSSEPVVVDFWAEWCGPCRMIAPALEEIASEMKGKVKIAKLNVDENPGVAGKYRHPLDPDPDGVQGRQARRDQDGRRPQERTFPLDHRRRLSAAAVSSIRRECRTDGPQAADAGCRRADVAAVRAGDVAGDRQAEAGAAFVLVARLVQPVERPEHVLPVRRRDAGAVVVDDDRDELRISRCAEYPHVVGVALGVGDEVADAALDRHRPHPDVEVAPGLEADLAPRAARRQPARPRAASRCRSRVADSLASPRAKAR